MLAGAFVKCHMTATASMASVKTQPVLAIERNPNTNRLAAYLQAIEDTME